MFKMNESLLIQYLKYSKPVDESPKFAQTSINVEKHGDLVRLGYNEYETIYVDVNSRKVVKLSHN